MVGGALGLAVLAALATARTNDQLKLAASHVNPQVLHAALTSGFKLAFIVAAAFAAVGVVIAAFGIPGIPRQRAAARSEALVESA
jgi:TRAP-type uncharacterized transport system fused permease subunit